MIDNLINPEKCSHHVSSGKFVWELVVTLRCATSDVLPMAGVHLQPVKRQIVSVQFSSVAQSCPAFCNSMDCSMPGLPVHH